MTTEERINAINLLGTRKKEEQKKSLQDRAKTFEDYKNGVRQLAERAKALLKVARTLDENGLVLGELTGGHTKTPRFVSDGICHRFGFLVQGNEYLGSRKYLEPYAIGIKGGGCNGFDHAIDEDAEFMTLKFNEYVSSEGLQYFLDAFDKFEKDFYEYVDNICK